MFEELLNQSSTNITVHDYDMVEQLLKKPTKEEVKIRLDILKNIKGPDDEIVSECLKMGGQCLLNILYKLMNFWEQEEIPEAWRISVQCDVHNKGNIIEFKITEESHDSTRHINYCLIYY